MNKLLLSYKPKSISEITVIAIKAGILAPSTHNSQPWEVSITDSGFILHKLELDLKQADPDDIFSWISVGAFLENSYQIAAFYRFKMEVTAIKGTNIEVNFTKTNEVLSNYAAEIEKRYSEKRIFASKKMSSVVKNKLMKADGVSFFSDDPGVIKSFAKHQYEASASYQDNKFFAKELSSWLRITKKHNDGMHHQASGIKRAKFISGKYILKLTPKILKPMAEKYLHLVSSSSGVGYIGSKSLSPKDLVVAGRNFEKFSLLASSNKLSVTPLAAMLGNQVAYKYLNSINKTKLSPVLVFRISDTQEPVYHTNRKQYKIVIRG